MVLSHNIQNNNQRLFVAHPYWVGNSKKAFHILLALTLFGTIGVMRLFSASTKQQLAGVKTYQQDFPFTMQNSIACKQVLEDTRTWRKIARQAIQDYLSQGHKAPHERDSGTRQFQQAEQAWHHALNACHGPLPTIEEQQPLPPTAVVSTNYTLRSFMDGMILCGRGAQGGHLGMWGGMWCREPWTNLINWAMETKKNWWERITQSERKFILLAECALKFEFPLTQTSVANNNNKPSFTNRQRRPDWKPKRTLILTPTMGDKGAVMGCNLVSTAYPRGWEVVLIEGEYRGLTRKYSDALAALEMVVNQETEQIVAPEDILVVFADSIDVMAQRSPEYVVEAFLDYMTTDFAFSVETSCFPMALWPNSLGVPYQVCDGMFPGPSMFDPPLHKGRHGYANTGGWIGIASAALVVLKELATVIEQEDKDSAWCTKFGTDQLLGNAAHLRHPSLVGLDVDSAVFASDALAFVGRSPQLGKTSLTPSSLSSSVLAHAEGDNIGYCTHNGGRDPVLCPAFLHFNGGDKTDAKLANTFNELVSASTLKTCRQGTVFIAHIGQRKLWREIFEQEPRWQECRMKNICVNG